MDGSIGACCREGIHLWVPSPSPLDPTRISPDGGEGSSLALAVVVGAAIRLLLVVVVVVQVVMLLGLCVGKLLLCLVCVWVGGWLCWHRSMAYSNLLFYDWFCFDRPNGCSWSMHPVVKYSINHTIMRSSSDEERERERDGWFHCYYYYCCCIESTSSSSHDWK